MFQLSKTLVINIFQSALSGVAVALAVDVCRRTGFLDDSKATNLLKDARLTALCALAGVFGIMVR